MTDKGVFAKVAGAKDKFCVYMLHFERMKKCCTVCAREGEKKKCNTCKVYVQRNRRRNMQCTNNEKCRTLGSVDDCGFCRMKRYGLKPEDSKQNSTAKKGKYHEVDQ